MSFSFSTPFVFTFLLQKCLRYRSSLKTDPPLHKGDSMGENNRSVPLTAYPPARFLTLPKNQKKRPAAAGLFPL
jgi:hypothetical protein